MENQHVIEQLNDFLEGSLERTQELQILNHLNNCEDCANELESLKILFQEFKDEEPIRPSSKLRATFLANLEKEKREVGKKEVILLESKKRSEWKNNFFKIAASIVVLFGVYWLGTLENKVKPIELVETSDVENLGDKQIAMMSMMESQSASQRIKGLYLSEQFEKPDPEIMSVLIETMKFDANANVRLAAVEALTRFSDQEVVKQALIESLTSEKTPNIQISIIQILVKIEEKRALQPMKNLMENDSTLPYVREQLKSLIPVIS